MRKALCTILPSKVGEAVEIPQLEANHLISVLRLKPDDVIEILDGSGKIAEASLFYRGKVLFAQLTTAPILKPELQSLPIHLTMAILKGDAMEWTIEKAVELGVRTFTPFESEFTVVDIRKKGAEVFQERWQKIADQALKQCGRLEKMSVALPTDFESVLLKKNRLIWLDESSHGKAQYIAEVDGDDLLVGPEGGFSPTEKNRLMQLSNKEIKRAHAGAAILRAETAALFGISVLGSKLYGKQ